MDGFFSQSNMVWLAPLFFICSLVILAALLALRGEIGQMIKNFFMPSRARHALPVPIIARGAGGASMRAAIDGRESAPLLATSGEGEEQSLSDIIDGAYFTSNLDSPRPQETEAQPLTLDDILAPSPADMTDDYQPAPPPPPLSALAAGRKQKITRERAVFATVLVFLAIVILFLGARISKMGKQIEAQNTRIVTLQEREANAPHVYIYDFGAPKAQQQ